MSKESDGMIARRVCADFIGDDATDLDILEVSLGIHRSARSKSDRDTLLLKASIVALTEAVHRYIKKTGVRYPDYEEFIAWMKNGETVKNTENDVVHLVPHSSIDTAENA